MWSTGHVPYGKGYGPACRKGYGPACRKGYGPACRRVGPAPPAVEWGQHRLP